MSVFNLRMRDCSAITQPVLLDISYNKLEVRDRNNITQCRTQFESRSHLAVKLFCTERDLWCNKVIISNDG